MKTIAEIRNDFPILKAEVRGKDLVYLDNGATAQKPSLVIDAINTYYKDYNSNIHRGVHHLSQVATTAYEEAREKLRGFINSPKLEEVIFTKGTTDSINIVASCFGRNSLNKGDEVIIPAFSYIATANVVELVGAKPIFVDIDLLHKYVVYPGYQVYLIPQDLHLEIHLLI